MNKYTQKPHPTPPPLIFDAVQWLGGESILKDVFERCEEINKVGRMEIAVYLDGGELIYHGTGMDAYGLGVRSPLKIGDYLIFTEDRAIFMEKQEFEEKYIPATIPA
jgi:hypothetical protein